MENLEKKETEDIVLLKIEKTMAYTKNIQIYTVKENFNSPLASTPDKCANSGIGGFVLIIDDEVWVQDVNNERKEQFALANYNPEFVRMNPFIFKEAEIKSVGQKINRIFDSLKKNMSVSPLEEDTPIKK